jgi:hypothetical protein
MAVEAKMGPHPFIGEPVNVQGANGKDKVSEDVDDEGGNESDIENEGDAFDPEKLRQYELDKLKYYFAIVVCDSVSTASQLYQQCDGMEYEVGTDYFFFSGWIALQFAHVLVQSSSNIMDLRFVPDDVTFPNAPRDSASKVPDDYEPPRFSVNALQLTKVDLTWDEPDPVRRGKCRVLGAHGRGSPWPRCAETSC